MRKGLRDEWDQIDTDIQDEIRRVWEERVAAALRSEEESRMGERVEPLSSYVQRVWIVSPMQPRDEKQTIVEAIHQLETILRERDERIAELERAACKETRSWDQSELTSLEDVERDTETP